MDVAWRDGPPAPMVCVNPQFVALSSETVEIEEGCLSIPDTPCLVRRPAALRLRWQDLSGAMAEADFDGIAARCIQHEADHLDGVLCTDRVVAA